MAKRVVDVMGLISATTLVVAVIGAARAQPPVAAAKPPTTTAPADDDARALGVFNTLLQQGTNALAAGEYSAALESLQDAKQIFERKLRGKGPVGVGSPEHIALTHGLALAYQLVHKPDKASPLFDNNSPLDRACNAKGVSRRLLVTRGVMDVTQGYLAMRTCVGLTNYLKEHPDELDSEILDLLYTALIKAEEKVANRQLMLDPMIKLYEDFNGRLESTRPGQKRWGVQWVSEETFRAEMAKQSIARKKYEIELDKVDKVAERVSAEQASVDVARKNALKDRAGLTRALGRLAAAKDALAVAQDKAEEVRRAIPMPPVLTKEALASVLTPHDVKVVVAAKPKTGSTAAVASADGASRAVPFSLGGSSAPKTAVGGSSARPPTGGPATVAPPTFEPTASARRTFSRSATGFAVAPDLLLTAASAVKGANRVMIELPGAQPIEVTVERVGDEGLALLRAKGQRFAYLNVATQFNGGPIKCPAYPEVSVFGVTLEMIQGRALAVKDEGWQVALSRHPRLPGAPLLDSVNNLVGVEVGDRDDLTERLPAIGFAKVKSFLGADGPTQPCGNPQAAAIVQITASFER
jgi:hypothetical protein